MRRPRLLITGTISRADILDMFARLDGAADMTFLEYERDWGDGVDPSLYSGLGELVTWEESRSADAILRTVKPDRVILLFTSSLNQVALRQAARDRQMQTIHIEHGYRIPPEDAPPEAIAVGRQRTGRLSSKRTNMFFVRSLSRRGPGRAQALARYAIEISRTGATPTVLRSFADLRRPDRYISYSQECFRYHRYVDRIPDSLVASTTFTGVPQFDDFRVTNQQPTESSVLLIDHQFHNSGLFGWDEAFRHAWVRSVADAIFAAGTTRLYVRLHPGDRSRTWDPLLSARPIQVVSRNELVGLSRSVPVVLGTFSTMQLPFAALPHVAMLSLEIHPERGRFPSRRLYEAGVTEPVRSYQELGEALRHTDSLREHQRPHKSAFTARFLETLDGGAGDRLARSLLE